MGRGLSKNPFNFALDLDKGVVSVSTNHCHSGKKQIHFVFLYTPYLDTNEYMQTHFQNK